MATEDHPPQEPRPALSVIPGGQADSPTAMAARGPVILTDAEGKTAAVAPGLGDLHAAVVAAGDWVDQFLEESEWFREAVARSDPFGG